MHLDEFLARNQPTWTEFDVLTRRASRGLRQLRPVEIDELLRLYQLTSTHLSYAETAFSDDGLPIRLSQLVANAAAVIYGTRPRTWRDAARYFTTTLPAALYHVRRFLLISAALMFLPAIGVGVWLANSPKAVDASAPAALREALINHDFADYYRAQPSAQFATEVYTHNIVVSAEAFAGGVVVCVPTVLLLATNGANLGVDGGLFSAAGQDAKFWGLVIPHGLIELTSVVIAGAAGLSLGWSIIDPGDRRRRDAMAEAGQRAVTLVAATLLTLGIAGTIEGFVTGSALPTAARVGTGVAVEVALLAYAFVLGRRAHRAGYTGLLGEGQRGGWIRSPSAAGPATAGPSL